MAENANYSDQKGYIKFLKNKCNEVDSECNEGCDDSECSCCPVGLVAVYNQEGKHLGCLTPNDAEEFHKLNFTCEDGYVKLIKNGVTPQFLGCVSQDEFAALYIVVNPPV